MKWKSFVWGCAAVVGMLAVLQLLPVLFFLFLMASPSGDELLLTSVSPQGTYTLQAHRINPGATEPYSIRVFRVEGDRERRIYAVRGQSEAEIVWLSESVAAINGLLLGLSEGEVFEAYENQYFSVQLQVAAPDVQAVTIRMASGDVNWLSRAESAEGALCLRETYWRDDLAEHPIRMTVTVETADGASVTLPFCWTWTAQPFGGTYGFTLTGSAESGYNLETPGFACEVNAGEEVP